MKFTLRSVCRETGKMTAMASGAKQACSNMAQTASVWYNLCDFIVTKNVPSRRLYGDPEPGMFNVITLERWSNGKQIYKKGRK